LTPLAVLKIVTAQACPDENQGAVNPENNNKDKPVLATGQEYSRDGIFSCLVRNDMALSFFHTKWLRAQ